MAKHAACLLQPAHADGDVEPYDGSPTRCLDPPNQHHISTGFEGYCVGLESH